MFSIFAPEHAICVDRLAPRRRGKEVPERWQRSTRVRVPLSYTFVPSSNGGFASPEENESPILTSTGFDTAAADAVCADTNETDETMQAPPTSTTERIHAAQVRLRNVICAA